MASVQSPLLMVFMVVLIIVSTLSVSLASSLGELLQFYGLPQGIFPNNVKRFSLDDNDVLDVELESPCLVMLENMMYFEKIVRANITQEKLLGVKGLANKELFVWLPVRNIFVNYPYTDLVLLDISLANKTLSVSVFDEPPTCQLGVQFANRLTHDNSKKQLALNRNGDNKEDLWLGLKKAVLTVFWNILGLF